MDAICGYCLFGSSLNLYLNICLKNVVKYRKRVLCYEAGRILLYSKEFNLKTNSISYESIAIDYVKKTITVNHTQSKRPAAKLLKLQDRAESTSR